MHDYTVLVIEDDPALLQLMSVALARAGHQVLTAKGGLEGLIAFEAACVDLVITDLVMPNGEGLEALLSVKRRCPGVKVIAISGGGYAAGQDLLEMARTLGADFVIAKPFRMNELLSCAENLLRLAAQFEPVRMPAGR